MGPKRWHTRSQSPGRVPRISSPRSSATWSGFQVLRSGQWRGEFCHRNSRIFYQSAILITVVLITRTWPSFTNHQHHSIRARSSHKHIVWSPLWKRTQHVCQATYLNSCFKFPRSSSYLPLSAHCVPVWLLQLPSCIQSLIPSPGNTLRHPTISQNLVTENISISIISIQVK